MEYPTEQEYAEAFGVETENGSESAQERDLEQEGPDDGQTAENAGDGAEEGESEPSDRQGQEEEGTEKLKGAEMSPEDRRKWKERRIAWEAAEQNRAREEQARQAAEQARVDKVYADMFAGQTNPYTGQPIQTEADFRNYQAERERRQQTAQLQQAGIDPKTIQGIVDQRLAPMQQRLQMAELSAMQERAKAANARAQEAISRSLTNIGAMDPSVKSLEDIAKMPTAPRFNELVQKGIGMEDAFYLANRQAIDTRRAAASRAATINNMASRTHLNPTQNTAGKTPVEVPKAVVDAYRYMMPDATDAEIQKAYAAELENHR